ncbi:MAG: hypothetical protein RBT47_04945 [Anaerolineae bacterium]|jgi:hypothetical protein|nr:hypothetical protein [Anaerolineae bacterium]
MGAEMRSLIKVYSPIFVLLGLLVGCSVPVVPTATPTRALLSPTVTASPTMSLPSTSNPLPPTQPSVPTLTVDEEADLVQGLLRDNGGCRLPCWWNFTPSETSWHSAEVVFTSWGKRLWGPDDYQTTSYYVSFDIPSHNLNAGQNYFVKNDIIELINIHAEPPSRNDELVYGDPQFVADWDAYLLPQMLSVYGQPENVFLSVAADVPWAPFDLLLFYPEQGILVRYEAPAEWGEGVFRMCQYKSDITLWLWSPQHSPDRGHITAWENRIGEIVYFRSLEEATGTTVEEFYRIFSQPDGQLCLETPQELWQGEGAAKGGVLQSPDGRVIPPSQGPVR